MPANDDGFETLREPIAAVTIELDDESGDIRIRRQTALGTVTDHVER